MYNDSIKRTIKRILIDYYKTLKLYEYYGFRGKCKTDRRRLVFMIVGLILYMVLHELVHGICMKYFGTPKVNYGFAGLYAYAGSNAYFTKKPYIIIALAPVVVWGIVLLVINLFVDASWFWCVYFIQICNISGAVGDIYVTYKFSKMPKDILVQDML